MAKQLTRQTKIARILRRKQTSAESLLWHVLRGRQQNGLKFRRQFPIDRYYVDFACLEKRLVIEVDGEYHDYVGEADIARQAELESMGWKVVRFSNEDVLDDIDAICVAIKKVAESGITNE